MTTRSRSTQLRRGLAAAGMAVAIVAGGALTAGAESPPVDIPLDIVAPDVPVDPELDLPLTSGDETEKRLVKISLIGVHTFDDGDNWPKGCGEFYFKYEWGYGDEYWVNFFQDGIWDAAAEGWTFDNHPVFIPGESPTIDAVLCEGDPAPYTDLTNLPGSQIGTTVEVGADQPLMFRFRADEYDDLGWLLFPSYGDWEYSGNYGFSVEKPQVFEEWMPVGSEDDSFELVVGVRIEVSEVPDLAAGR